MLEYADFHIPRHLFFQLIAIYLLVYKRYKDLLASSREKKDAATVQNALNMLIVIGNGVDILLKHAGRGIDFEKDTWFFPELENHCSVYHFDIKPRELISDILSKRFINNPTMQ